MLCPYRAATHAKKREPMYTGSVPSTAPPTDTSTDPVTLILLLDDDVDDVLDSCGLTLVAAPPLPPSLASFCPPAARWWGLDRPV